MGLLYSHGHTLKPVASLGIQHCAICAMHSNFYVVKAKKTLKVLLIPLLNWNERLWVMCDKCKAYKDISIDEFNKILKIPTTYVTKDLILKKEWYEYPLVWLIILILAIGSFFGAVLLSPERTNANSQQGNFAQK